MIIWFLNLFRRADCLHLDTEWISLKRGAREGWCKLCGQKFGSKT